MFTFNIRCLKTLITCDCKTVFLHVQRLFHVKHSLFTIAQLYLTQSLLDTVSKQ